jgi:hypothetical protein
MKSHAKSAQTTLGHRACRLGHRTLFLSAQEMLKQSRAGKGDGTYDRRLTKIAEVDLLTIDDLGLRPLAHDEPVDLYEVIRLRYEREASAHRARETQVHARPISQLSHRGRANEGAHSVEPARW